MERIYIEGNMARFICKDLTLVDVILSDGKTFENLEPRRLFPSSDPNRYITLLDDSGAERAVIRDLRTLPEQDRAVIAACLAEYYLIPRVVKILDRKEKFGIITLFTETDRGPATIEIRNILNGLKLVQERRVLLRDQNDNRYEIPDINALDKHSRLLLDHYI